MNKSITHGAKQALKALEELGIEAEQYEGRMVWHVEMEYRGVDCMLVVQAEDEDVIQIFASILRAKNESHRAAVIDFIARFNERFGRHTHLEYDFNYNSYRMAGLVMYGEDRASLSTAMVRGMILRCLNGMQGVVDTLRGVEAGKLDAERGMAAYLESLESPSEEATEVENESENAATASQKMRLTETLRQWLKEREWEEQPEIGEDGKSSSTGFGLTVGDFNLKCWFEADEQGEVMSLYMYYRDAKVPEKRMEEMTNLVIDFAPRVPRGSLHLRRNEREIRFVNAIDVEGASFEPAHITGLLRAGSTALEYFLPKYMAVCFGGKTAAEALEEDAS